MVAVSRLGLGCVLNWLSLQHGMRHKLAVRRVAARLLLLMITLQALVMWTPAGSIQFDADQLVKEAKQRYGPSAAGKVSGWIGMLQTSQTESVQEQLRSVNRFWNATLRPAEDIDLWNKDDHWATPLESLVRGAGDCEDYVIGKYFSLLYLGVPAERLRLIYVRANTGGKSVAHMVLGYFSTPSSEPLILDSLSSSIMGASRRPDLTPVFSFNAQGIYVAGQQRSVDSISRWQDLLNRMRTEGVHP